MLHDTWATSAQRCLRNILIEHLELDKTGKANVLLEPKKDDAATGKTCTALSLTERLPCPVYPTMVLFNVFTAAAGERNVAETITKQLFSPDNKDDKPKRNVRSRNVTRTRGRPPSRQSARLRGRGRGISSASPPKTLVKQEPVTPPHKG